MLGVTGVIEIYIDASAKQAVGYKLWLMTEIYGFKTYKALLSSRATLC